MKKLLSKVHNRPNFFFSTYCQPAQNKLKSHFLFLKNVSLRDFYVMTLASGKGDALGGCAALPAFFATILYGIKAYKLIKPIYEDIKKDSNAS